MVVLAIGVVMAMVVVMVTVIVTVMVMMAFAPVWAAHDRARTGGLALRTQERDKPAHERKRGKEPQQPSAGAPVGEGASQSIEALRIHVEPSLSHARCGVKGWLPVSKSPASIGMRFARSIQRIGLNVNVVMSAVGPLVTPVALRWTASRCLPLTRSPRQTSG
jgi:hypothetical protein